MALPLSLPFCFFLCLEQHPLLATLTYFHHRLWVALANVAIHVPVGHSQNHREAMLKLHRRHQGGLGARVCPWDTIRQIRLSSIRREHGCHGDPNTNDNLFVFCRSGDRCRCITQASMSSESKATLSRAWGAEALPGMALAGLGLETSAQNLGMNTFATLFTNRAKHEPDTLPFRKYDQILCVRRIKKTQDETISTDQQKKTRTTWINTESTPYNPKPPA